MFVVDQRITDDTRAHPDTAPTPEGLNQLNRIDAVIVSRGAAESAEREGRSQAFQRRQPFTKR
jgi:hypothetical protein